MFIGGMDRATSWDRLEETLPRSILLNSRFLDAIDLRGIGNREFSPTEERLIFINQHGFNCKIKTYPDTAIPIYLKRLFSIFPSDSLFVHLGACSTMRYSCTHLPDLLSSIPNLAAVTGYSKDVPSLTSLKLEANLKAGMQKNNS